mgnify:CR=1 FL=1|tara:strand:- start:4995 stop:5474 length:480 start_codon:yes stop_codon:yes gene_type:complete
MAINLSNGKTLSEVGGKISAPGRIVQTVHTISNAGVATSSTSPVNLFTSNAITMTNASNKLLIEFQSDNRSNDWGDGVWNLHYMDIIHSGTGTQLSYSGYNGEQTFSIRGIHRIAVHSPGSVGPHTYTMRGWSYSANSTTFITGSDGYAAYIRISEVAV